MSRGHVERWTNAAGIAGTVLQLVAYGVNVSGPALEPRRVGRRTVLVTSIKDLDREEARQWPAQALFT